jgi:hypothetical protein
MWALLICPSERPALAFLARERPLPLLPAVGRSLLDWWLTELSDRGARHVLVLAADRPEQIRRAAGGGERWGLQVAIWPEARELSAGEARKKYRARHSGPWLEAPDDVTVMDHLPGGEPWKDPGDWYRSLRMRLPAVARQGVGQREVKPGVFVHARARVADSARLHAPCWVGAHAWVGSRSELGPGAILEGGCYVDDGATVVESWVGPGTYVGALTELRESLALGKGLCRWTWNTVTDVSDELLLGELRQRATRRRASSWAGRLAALLAMIAFSPVVMAGLARRQPGTRLFIAREAVRAPAADPEGAETCLYRELTGVRGLWRRWPQLWNIVRGEFAWVGNRPLNRREAGELKTDFERLWLAVPPGLVSLADAHGCADLWGDEGRAHASFYAAKNDSRTDLQILRQAFGRAWSSISDTLNSTHPIAHECDVR